MELNDYELNLLKSFNPGDEHTAEIKRAIDHMLREREEDKKRIQELEDENKVQKHQIMTVYDNGYVHKDKIKDEYIPKQKVLDEFNKLNTRIKDFKNPEIKKYFSIEQIIYLLEKFENKLWEDK